MAEPVVASAVERFTGRLLRAGVGLAAALLLAGLIAWGAGEESAWARGLFTAGFFVLMATPIVRILTALVEYVRAREWVFVLATLAVLGVLAGTLFVAYATWR